MHYTYSTTTVCALHTQYIYKLCSTHTVNLYIVQYTYSASLDCAVHTQYISTMCITHTVTLWNAISDKFKLSILWPPHRFQLIQICVFHINITKSLSIWDPTRLWNLDSSWICFTRGPEDDPIKVETCRPNNTLFLLCTKWGVVLLTDTLYLYDLTR